MKKTACVLIVIQGLMLSAFFAQVLAQGKYPDRPVQISEIGRAHV